VARAGYVCRSVKNNMYGKLTSEYFELVMESIKPLLRLDDPNDRREMGEALMNDIYKTGGPKALKIKSSRKADFMVDKIFRPMGEITTTIGVLEDIAIYIRHFPYGKKDISPLSYLHYHIENYLNELYILKNRLISYLNIIDKAYRKSGISKEVSGRVKALYADVSTAFEPRTKVRGYHVHEYRVTNQDLDRLRTLDLLSRGNDQLGKTMRQLFLVDYRKTRKEWANSIEKEIREIKKLLDNYFGQLRQVLFQDKELIIPENYK
jgi:hypothetical protein